MEPVYGGDSPIGHPIITDFSRRSGVLHFGDPKRLAELFAGGIEIGRGGPKGGKDPCLRRTNLGRADVSLRGDLEQEGSRLLHGLHVELAGQQVATRLVLSGRERAMAGAEMQPDDLTMNFFPQRIQLEDPPAAGERLLDRPRSGVVLEETT